ncbi:MAG: gamma carbonic anhydrase family protein [Rhodospirillales bacterium]
MPKVYAIDGVVPVVDPAAYVHPMAVLIGDVIVGPRSFIGPGASLRGDFSQIVIGAGSSVQDNVTVHSFANLAVRVGDNCGIGHGAVLHGCTIGDGVLVGMNAVVMDGVEIGDEAIVSALAFVPATFKVPPRMLAAGVPARLIREIDQETIDWKTRGTGDYVRLTARCLATMQEVDALTRPEKDGPRLHVEGTQPLFMQRRR